MRNRKHWRYVFRNISPEIQQFYQRMFEFDLLTPSSTKKGEGLFGRYHNIIYYLSEIPLMESNDLWHGLTGTSIYALVFFKKNIPFDLVKHCAFNRIILKKGDKIGMIKCTHTIIYSGSLSEFEEEDTSLLFQAENGLFPWEHFAALKSYVSSIAEFGIFNLLKQATSNLGDDLPFGFNSPMQGQFILALSNILPAIYIDELFADYYSGSLKNRGNFYLPRDVLRKVASPEFPQLFTIFAEVAITQKFPRLDRYLLLNPLISFDIARQIYARKNLRYLMDQFLLNSKGTFCQSLSPESVKALIISIQEKAVIFLNKFSIKQLICAHLEDLPSAVLETLADLIKISPLFLSRASEIPFISNLNLPEQNSKWINILLNPLKMPTINEMRLRELWYSRSELKSNQFNVLSMPDKRELILKKQFTIVNNGFHKIILPKQINGKRVILAGELDGGYCGAIVVDPDSNPPVVTMCSILKVTLKRGISAVAIDRNGAFYAGKIE